MEYQILCRCHLPENLPSDCSHSIDITVDICLKCAVRLWHQKGGDPVLLSLYAISHYILGMIFKGSGL